MNADGFQLGQEHQRPPALGLAPYKLQVNSLKNHFMPIRSTADNHRSKPRAFGFREVLSIKHRSTMTVPRAKRRRKARLESQNPTMGRTTSNGKRILHLSGRLQKQARRFRLLLRENTTFASYHRENNGTRGVKPHHVKPCMRPSDFER